MSLPTRPILLLLAIAGPMAVALLGTEGLTGRLASCRAQLAWPA